MSLLFSSSSDDTTEKNSRRGRVGCMIGMEGDREVEDKFVFSSPSKIKIIITIFMYPFDLHDAVSCGSTRNYSRYLRYSELMLMRIYLTHLDKFTY